MSIGQNLKKLREVLDLTQGKFAEHIGVSRYSITDYEREVTQPGADFCTLLISKFDVNINWLLTGKGEMFNFCHTSDKMERFSKLFPSVPPEPNIVEMVESMEIPVMRYQLIGDYLVRKEQHKLMIEEFNKNKDLNQRGVK